MKRLLALVPAAVLFFSCFPLTAFAAGGSGGGGSGTGGDSESSQESQEPQYGVDRTLTVQQTVALFGNELHGTWYDKVTDTIKNIRLQYWCPASELGVRSDTTHPIKWQLTQNSDMQGRWYAFDAAVYYASYEDWGGGSWSPSWQTELQFQEGSKINLNIPFTITIPDVNRFSMNMFYSLAPGFSSYLRSDRAKLETYTTQGTEITFLDSSSTIPRYGQLPMYPYEGGTLNENETSIFCAMFQDISGERFNVTGMNLVANWVGVNGNGELFVMVGCPTLRQDAPITTAPPPVTTAPQTTRVTGSYHTAATYVTGSGIDLSNIESGIREIIWNQEQQRWQLNWIGTNAMYAVDNLAAICDKLDAIYDLMKEQGDITETDNTDFNQWMLAALSTHTTARIPDEAQDGLSFIAYLLSNLNQISWFAAIGALGLATGVAYWIIFKGRG